MHKVLLIEDDDIIGEMIRMYLTEENFLVLRAHNGQEGVLVLNEFEPELILLDLKLPDFEGTDLCNTLRKITTVPIIIISANSKVSEKIKAFTVGADDYLCKPFSMHEMKARILAVLRRLKQAPPAMKTVHALNHSEAPKSVIDVNIEKRILFVQGEATEITFSEFELIKLLFGNPEKVFRREDLINGLRGFDYFVNDRSIDVHITNLRRKIEKNPKEPRHIKTVRGVGYKFVL
ncbi:DNA-binding response regulator [Paenibacillus baekrokdamisoli]|uniref:DNA-binding response regulator n=1 Tax=Paenibacillus baekrokdamisoli TaxID=1712516 RepID=A0A3G9JNH3_9BACL|nr:response regulator transcription factor [Paenibacillus baekrokdamisoli]MBB3071376.1 DNA-binding response OmpR family regulator [Paenibacillus baekrokdamisoli]BBH24589.1 DNA-binding response regulator [Paenibacillus baekrokdamisoli]